jgi:hypothetical protein
MRSQFRAIIEGRFITYRSNHAGYVKTASPISGLGSPALVFS